MEFDVNGDGVMDEDEFVKFCQSDLDNDGERKVVLKFMVERDQWEREIKSRDEFGLSSEYIVDVLCVRASDRPLAPPTPLSWLTTRLFAFASVAQGCVLHETRRHGQVLRGP